MALHLLTGSLQSCSGLQVVLKYKLGPHMPSELVGFVSSVLVREKRV